jgi:hypothetical protein
MRQRRAGIRILTIRSFIMKGVAMKFKHLFPLAVVLAVLPLIGSVCDVGLNPLLFDGSPLTASVVVHAHSTTYDNTATIDLSKTLSDIKKDIDSADIYNITLKFRNDGSTPAGTTASGSVTINNIWIFTLNTVKISDFAKERSIFRLPAGSISLNRAGIRQLRRLLWQISRNGGAAYPVSVHLFGTSSQLLDVTAFVTLYTQVFTPPPKK